MVFSPNAATVYADGPGASPQQPSKLQIRTLLTQYETAIDAYSSGAGSIAKSTRALLYADLAHAADVTAWVYADSTTAYNGIYRKSGASGSGSWSKILALPYSFAVAVDAGAGTANAILVTSQAPSFDGAVYCFSLFEATTGSPVTVSINGGTALTLKTNRGSNASALTAGMDVWGRVRTSDNTFRLLNDQDVAALVAQAEAAAASAQASAEEAAGYADFALNNWVVSGPFTGTGSEEDYLLLVDPGSVNNLFVSAGGAFPLTTSYEVVAVSGSYYLRATVPNGVVFEVRTGNAIDVNTPSAGSVTRASLATSATLEGQIAAATDAAFSDTDMLIARKSDGSSVKRSWGNVKSALSTGKARFRAHKNNVNQAGIASATDTKLTFATEASDVGGFYDAATSKWTPPAGAVFLNSVCQITGTFSATVQVAYLQIFKNGVLFAAGASVHDANTGNTSASVTCTDDANGSDFYEVYLNVATASGTATVTGAIVANRFEGFII
ncbi:hypothetical protein [Rhizobium sp. SGZ-381]|uniref:hypothetical protein n=1 Tax=Rhizobium sp. SGZ-381 TaxID=3342800 RepID=UPI00366CBBF7